MRSKPNNSRPRKNEWAKKVDIDKEKSEEGKRERVRTRAGESTKVKGRHKVL